MSEPGDCRHCRDYRDCPSAGKDTYHYAEIRFCPYQVIWILSEADTLRDGDWPGSNVISASQRSIKTEAAFVKPELIIAEVESRLQMTGDRAELLITQVEDGRTFSNLSNGAMEVLMYVKGWRQKRIGFKKWLREVYYKPKTGEKRQLVGVT